MSDLDEEFMGQIQRMWPGMTSMHAKDGAIYVMGDDGVALPVRPTCGTCQHWNEDQTFMTRRLGFCTSQVSWFNAKAMPEDEGCTKWEPRI